MFGAALTQGAQSHNRINSAGGQFTPDYYLSKQRDCQIVRIQSSDSEFQVNCPNVRPNFSGLSMMTGAHMQDMYYQVRCFSTIPKYYNCEEGMTLRLRINRYSFYDKELVNTSIKDPKEPYRHVVKPDGGHITLRLDLKGKQCLNQQELVDYVGWEISRTYYKLANEESKYVTIFENKFVTQEQAFTTIFDFSHFSYSGSATNKLSYYMKTDSTNFRLKRSAFRENVNGVLWSQKDKLLGGVELTLSCDPTMTKDFQIRLGRMLGFTEMIKSGDGPEELGNSFFVGDTALIPFYLTKEPNYFQGKPVTLWAQGLEVTVPPTNNNYQLRSNFVDTVFYDTCKAPMKMVRYNRIFIRSSLLNNMWRADGSKGDEICVVPITGSLEDNIIIHTPTGSDMRTYEVKETNNGAVSFSLRITDENNDLVEFLEDYELQLAFFYCPDKTQVSQF